MTNPRQAKQRKILFIKALTGKSEVLNLTGQNQEALHVINRSLDFTKEIRDRKLQADCLVQLSRVQSSTSRYEDMLRSVQKSLRIYQKHNEKQGKATSLTGVGYVNFVLGNYPKALEYWIKSLKIAKEINNVREQATNLNNIAILHGDLGEYNRALLCNKKSLSIRKAIGHHLGEAYSLKNIGWIHIEQGKLTEAKRHFDEAEKIAREIGDRELLRRLAISFGELELAGHKIKKGQHRVEVHANEALEFARKLKSKSGEAEALLLQARIDVTNGCLEAVDLKFKKVITVFEELRQQFDLAKAYFYYGEMLKKKHEVKKATKIFRKIGAKGWLKKVIN